MNNTIYPSWVPAEAYGIANPNNQTVLFHIGSTPFYLYSLMILLGFLCSILTVFYFWHREKFKIDTLMTLIIITVPTAILGARLGYVIEALLYDPSFSIGDWYKIWQGGLSIQGGVTLAAICDLIYLYTQRNVIDIRKAASLVIPAILIGQVIGRWGNFGNHELYGKIDWSGKSSLVFGHGFASHMFISDNYSQALGLNGAYRYPLFLYEGIANFVGYLTIVWIINFLWLLKPGASAGLYFIWYGTVRLSMEPLRQDSFNLYIYASLAFIIFGLLIFSYFQFFSRVKYQLVKQNKRRTYVYANPEQYANNVNVSSFGYLYKKLIITNLKK
ncbi:prolipoprotein diacylglyceryl transferase [Mycoplasma sp. NEAQ87857]|uniref:prolipoprotein diacylglyceryl transferase n=1 Tax=Mycoplasma sp. NEAQ87857 TaxID=2683967 RepID=UPI0013197088|nr:prolipoprotein diacylglyceryl transferase [Mycoplasma sp. NEAQ87857]QGZ97412.1 prolipoprotein diacylglyceryl transferase [Mycoplasma sp. NEAQ87857]